jgi:hypothetical protein
MGKVDVHPGCVPKTGATCANTVPVDPATTAPIVAAANSPAVNFFMTTSPTARQKGKLSPQVRMHRSESTSVTGWLGGRRVCILDRCVGGATCAPSYRPRLTLPHRTGRRCDTAHSASLRLWILRRSPDQQWRPNSGGVSPGRPPGAGTCAGERPSPASEPVIRCRRALSGNKLTIDPLSRRFRLLGHPQNCSFQCALHHIERKPIL